VKDNSKHSELCEGVMTALLRKQHKDNSVGKTSSGLRGNDDKRVNENGKKFLLFLYFFKRFFISQFFLDPK
jgi:hypothetical protein